MERNNELLQRITIGEKVKFKHPSYSINNKLKPTDCEVVGITKANDGELVYSLAQLDGVKAVYNYITQENIVRYTKNIEIETNEVTAESILAVKDGDATMTVGIKVLHKLIKTIQKLERFKQDSTSRESSKVSLLNKKQAKIDNLTIEKGELISEKRSLYKEIEKHDKLLLEIDSDYKELKKKYEELQKSRVQVGGNAITKIKF